MQVATLMVLRTLGLLCYTTSSRSSLRPSLRAICGDRLRQGRRNASNPRCACAVGCGLGRRFCGTSQRHRRRHPRNSWDADPPFGGSMHRKDSSYAAARTALDTTAARWPQTTSTPSSPGQLCSEWLVRNGLALDWPQYSKGKYGEAQRDAERLAEESGRAAMSSHGCIGRASGWAALRPTARTTPTPIPDRPP
jgi:hypothetical protein